MQSAAQRAARIIADLLDYTQGHLGGGIPVARSPVDLHAVARQVVEEIAGNHSDRTIELTHEGDAHGTWDSDRVAQALGNIVLNAMSYSPKETPVAVKVGGADAARGALRPQPGHCHPRRQAAAHLRTDATAVGQSALGEPQRGARALHRRRNVAAHQGTVHVASSEAGGTTSPSRYREHPADG